jgi:hypothetical protein
MADTKISALTAATTPLAGTEVLPIVQSGVTVKVAVSNLTAGRAMSATSVTASTGNFVVGTSGQGIDFSATPGTGTSELLNDYEEGTWTPTQGGGLTVVGTYSSQGFYTKIGREVTLYGSVSGSTSIAVVAASNMVGAIPFTPVIQTSGSMNSNDGTKTGTVYMGSTTINSASVIFATSGIMFTITYFV